VVKKKEKDVIDSVKENALRTEKDNMKKILDFMERIENENIESRKNDFISKKNSHNKTKSKTYYDALRQLNDEKKRNCKV